MQARSLKWVLRKVSGQNPKNMTYVDSLTHGCWVQQKHIIFEISFKRLGVISVPS